MINSVLSRPNTKFCSFDIANFYLGTPTQRPEYVKIKLEDIPQEFIDEYNLLAYAHHGWVFLKLLKTVMASPRVVSWLMTSFGRASTRQVIMRLPPLLAYGSISGSPSSFV